MRLSTQTFRRKYLHIAAKWSNWYAQGLIHETREEIIRMRDHTYMFYKYLQIILACLSWPAWTERQITFTWILAQPSMTNDSTQHAWCLTGERYLVLQLPVFVQSEVQLAIKSISINVSSIHLVFNMQSNTDTLISWYLLVLLKKSTLFTTFTQTFTKTVTKLLLVRYHFIGYFIVLICIFRELLCTI